MQSLGDCSLLVSPESGLDSPQSSSVSAPTSLQTHRQKQRDFSIQLAAGSLSFLLKTSLTCMLQHLLQAALCLF